MKLLYVGHTYTVATNHAKILALAEHSDLQILLITPHAWKGPLYQNDAEPIDTTGRTNLRHEIVRGVGIGNEGSYLLSPRLFELILEFQPDIAHVEQGAYALVYSQVILALKRLSPTCRATFFTWWNLPYTASGVKSISETYNLQHSACAIVGNEAAKGILVEHGFSRPIYVLPQLGVDPSDRSLPSPDSRHFTIGYVGRIVEEKGVLDLVLAVAQASRQYNQKPLRLLMVGNGVAAERVKTLANELGVELEVRPAVLNSQVPDYLSRLNVLVLPSRSTPEWVEQFGHILLEAMAAGVPVVGSSSGEIPNVIGDAGLIFPEGDIDQLATALYSLAANPTLLSELAAKGIRRVQDHFTHEHIAEVQVSIYNWMMAHGQSVRELDQALVSSATLRQIGGRT